MSKIEFIDYVLNPSFKITHNFLEEKAASMKIDLIKTGCQSIVFQFDKKLGREYKGGLFPFFNNLNSDVCKVCDYIIFAERDKILYSLIIELKKGKSNTSSQLNAGECFVDYVISTVNRINHTNFTIQKRRISIREFERKKKTKERDVEYDNNYHHLFDQNKFRIIAFLK